MLRELHQLWADMVSLQKTIESFKRMITLGIGLVVCFAFMYWACFLIFRITSSKLCFVDISQPVFFL